MQAMCGQHLEHLKSSSRFSPCSLSTSPKLRFERQTEEEVEREGVGVESSNDERLCISRGLAGRT